MRGGDSGWWQGLLVTGIVPAPATPSSESFAYGPGGVRTGVTDASGATYYAYDPTSGSGTPTAEYASGGTLTARQLYAPDGSPLERITSAGGYYDHVDALGSVTSLTDASGGLRSAFRYASYGTTTSTSDQVGEPYGYVGQTTVAAAGLDALGARFYDPSTGRFLSTDAMGGAGTSTYAYAGDNPVAYTDPSGRSPCVAYCGRQGSWSGSTSLTMCARYCGHDGAGTNGGSNAGQGGSLDGSALQAQVTSSGWTPECSVLAAIGILNFVGGLIFGAAWDLFAGQSGASALVLASHLAMSVWVPEMLFASSVGDWGTVGSIGLEFAGFVATTVMEGIPWWEIPAVGLDETAEVGSGAILINLVTGSFGLGIILTQMAEQGCFSGA